MTIVHRGDRTTTPVNAYVHVHHGIRPAKWLQDPPDYRSNLSSAYNKPVDLD